MNKNETMFYNEIVDRVNHIVSDYSSGVLKEKDFIYYLNYLLRDISESPVSHLPEVETMVEAIHQALNSLESAE